MNCNWCGDEMDPFDYGGGLRHCSNDCYNHAIHHSAECLNARMEGEDPPSKEEFMSRRQRSRRWTVEKMNERVEQLKRGMV